MDKVVLIVMDGVGISDKTIGNAVYTADMVNLKQMMQDYPHTLLKAHGTAVGLPSDNDMGNSEVGHNALGCGQIYAQGAKLVDESIANGSIYESNTFKEMINNCIQNNSTFHFIGLLSDGNVHSNINHLFAIITKLKELGVHKVRVHILLDGRDVNPTSALVYVDKLEDLLKKLNDTNFDAQIASGGGRMKITMDRYKADWHMVELGYDTHVLGIGRQFNTAKEAIETYRKEMPGVIDQDLPPFVIAKDGKPVGTVEDNDSVLLFNFRGDRALEISMALEDIDFNYFVRKRFPKIYYAGMLEYDGDLHIPRHFLVNPPQIKNTLTEVLVRNNINEFAVSETQKFGHVTYFWNGNRTEKFDDKLETYMNIPSDNISFDQKPEMKANEITDAVIDAIISAKYTFIRANFPNGDMVGHTGNFDATVTAMKTIDNNLGRLLQACKNYNYVLIVTADHGNAEEMFDIKDGNKVLKTSHTLNPVPFVICDKKYVIKEGQFGLANVAPTLLKIFNIDKPNSWEDSIIK